LSVDVWQWIPSPLSIDSSSVGVNFLGQILGITHAYSLKLARRFKEHVSTKKIHFDCDEFSGHTVRWPIPRSWLIRLISLEEDSKRQSRFHCQSPALTTKTTVTDLPVLNLDILSRDKNLVAI